MNLNVPEKWEPFIGCRNAERPVSFSEAGGKGDGSAL